MLLECLDEGENIVVCMCWVNIELIQKLKTYFEVEKDENEYFVHYDSTNEAGKKELSDINVNWSKYRVVLYTSTVGAGLNYDPSVADLKKAGLKNSKNYIHFDRIFIFAKDSTLTQQLLFQMMGRVRKTRTSEVQVYVDNRMNKSTQEMTYMKDDALNYIRSVESIELPTLKMKTDDGTVNKVVVNGFTKLRAMFERDRMNTQAHVWLTVFDKQAREKGHELVYDFEQVKNKKAKQNLKKLVKDAVNIDQYVENPETIDDTLSNIKKAIVDELGINGFNNEMKDKYIDMFQKHHTIINTIIKHNSKDETNTILDEFDDKLFRALVVPFEEIVSTLHLTQGKHEYTPKQFATMLNKVTFDDKHLEIIRVKSKGAKLKDKMEIIKSILAKFGYVYKRLEKKTKIDKKVKRVVTGHVICINDDIFRTLALAVDAIGCEHFQRTFIDVLKQNHWQDVKRAKICNAILNLRWRNAISKQQHEEYLDYWSNENENVPEFTDIRQLMEVRGFSIKPGSMRKKLF